MKIKELLEWIECNLVMPYEGTLQSDNIEAVEIHRKITENNRTKFNELSRMLEGKTMRTCYYCNQAMYTSNYSVWIDGINYAAHAKCIQEQTKEEKQ